MKQKQTVIHLNYLNELVQIKNCCTKQNVPDNRPQSLRFLLFLRLVYSFVQDTDNLFLSLKILFSQTLLREKSIPK